MGNLSQRAVYAICFLTGFSALLYEVCWQRYLANLLGSNSRGTTLTLSVFLLGLGIGYFLFGKRTMNQPQQRLIRWYGLAEIGIGVWGGLFLLLYSVAWKSIGVVPLNQPIPLLYDFLIIFVAIGPATVLMGATLPLLTQAFCGDDESSGREHALLYAINTAGAGFGALVGGLFLLPSIGLFETNILAIVLNVFFGGVVILLFRGENTSPNKEREETSLTASHFIELLPYCLIGALIGFIGLSLQSLCIRILGISIGSSEATFSFVVASYIFLSAFGAWYFGKRRSYSLETVLIILAISLIIFHILVPYLPYLFHLVRIQFESSLDNFSAYYFSIFLALTVFLGLPVASLGSVLPMLVIRSESNKHIGEAVGYIYAANTVGSIIGVFCGGYLLFFILNLGQIYTIIFITSVLLSVLAYFTLPSETKKPTALIVSTICVITFYLIPSWNPRYLGFGLFREREATAESYQGRKAIYSTLLEGATILYQNDAADASVTIAEFEEDKEKTGVSYSRSMIINGKSDGNTLGDRRTMKLIGHIPALLRTNDGPVAVVGFGTGMTIGSLLQYPDISRIDVIEIESATKEFAPYFDFGNNDVSKSSKVNWYYNDAYRVFGGVDEKYSAVISQPSHPWFAGIERLYSKEYHEIVRSRLQDDGLYLHWFPLHDFSKESIALILNTTRKTFPHVRIFKSGFDVIVVGGIHPITQESLENLEERFKLEPIQKDLREIGITSPQYLFGMEQWLSPELYHDERYHSLLRPTLGSLARRDFFINQTIRLQLSFTQPKQWYENYLYSKDSLLTKWLQFSGEEHALAELLRAGCGSIKIQLVEPNWRYIRSVCRDAAIAALIEKNLTPPDHIVSEIAWLQSFLNEKEVQPLDQSPDAVIKDLALFAQYDSILLPLSEDVLLAHADSCIKKKDREHLHCRLQLIKTLTYTGRAEKAISLMKPYLADVSAADETVAKRFFYEQRDEIERFKKILTRYEHSQKHLSDIDEPLTPTLSLEQIE